MPDKPRKTIVASGRFGSIEHAVRTSGKEEAKEFMEGPNCQRTLAAFLALFQVIVDQEPQDDEIGPKPLTKTVICEFKKGQVRIFCFRDGRAWVLTHGDLKKTEKTPRANITRAERIMQEDAFRV